MVKYYRAALRVSLAAIFLVVLAGAVVRMSGAGMGCPDWPKCFGYLIPPTQTEQVLFKEGREFKKGQMIVHEEQLYKAKADFTAQEAFNVDDWITYTKHDYAIFNPVHTWIEFINRLLGAFSGLPVLAVLILSLQFIKRRPLLTFLAFATLVLLLFQAWLGKLVVDGNLIPNSITIHMFGALVIVAILIAQISLTSGNLRFSVPGKYRVIVGVMLVLIAAQFIMGTQVREQVDYLFKDNVARANIIENLSFLFYIHRSTSILVLVLAIYVGLKLKGLLPPTVWFWYKVHIILVFAMIFTGVLLNYFKFNAASQPLHLLLGFGVFGTLFWFWLNIKKEKALV
ncbi:MAG: COX15/CtaA family protein [Luteibaculaceae bacterium]